MRELLVQLAPVIMGVTSVPPSFSESALATTVETRSMSAPAKSVLVANILEDLIIYMIDQFFSMMTYCTEIVLSERTHFEFVRHCSRITLRTSEKSGVSIELRCTRHT